MAQIPYQNLETANSPTPWVIIEPSNSKDWAVLWLQGWGSTIEGHYDMMKNLAESCGITFAMIDYAGFGIHATPLQETTRQQQHGQVIAAYDALKSSGYKNIIALGHSFGSYMSALLAHKRRLAAIILRAPAIYDDVEFDELQKDRDDAAYQAFKNTVRPSSQLAALQAIRNFAGPVYVFEYGNDEVIPANITKSYFECASQGNYCYIPGVPHSPKTASEPQKYYNYIETIILDTLRAVQQQYTQQLTK